MLILFLSRRTAWRRYVKDDAAIGVGMGDESIGQPPDFRQSLRVLGIGTFP